MVICTIVLDRLTSLQHLAVISDHDPKPESKCLVRQHGNIVVALICPSNEGPKRLPKPPQVGLTLVSVESHVVDEEPNMVYLTKAMRLTALHHERRSP